jgi:methylmalonyl-CoA/ethylmalonyl-CoA epimerase
MYDASLVDNVLDARAVAKRSFGRRAEDMGLVEEAQVLARMHHLGFVVPDIQKSVEGFARSIGASWDAKVFHDGLQKVRVSFLRSASPTDPQIELVEPAAADSPVLSFLKKGGGLHHLCYEVADLDAHLAKVRKEGATMVKAPQPAVAFENRRIAWVFSRQNLLLEFLEQQKA